MGKDKKSFVVTALLFVVPVVVAWLVDAQYPLLWMLVVGIPSATVANFALAKWDNWDGLQQLAFIMVSGLMTGLVGGWVLAAYLAWSNASVLLAAIVGAIVGFVLSGIFGYRYLNAD